MHKRSIGAALLLMSLVLTVSLVVTACGGGDSEGLMKRELPENATPEKIMLEGLNATDEVDSLHFVYDYSVMIPPSAQQAYTTNVELNGEGEYDHASGNQKATIEYPAFEAIWNYVLYDGVQYFQESEGGPWYELPGDSGLSIPSISEITRNTAEYMDNFQKITRLEDEMVNDRDCYHIAMVPNLDAIMENEQFMELMQGDQGALDEDALAELQKTMEDLKEANVNYEYWFDKETLVLRRMLTSVEIVEQVEEGASPYTVKIIMETDFPTYNQKVEIDKPEVSMLEK
jgi:hypothetical protein